MDKRREVMAVTKDGSKSSVEIGLNLNSDKVWWLVLVSITNLSVRKDT